MKVEEDSSTPITKGPTRSGEEVHAPSTVGMVGGKWASRARPGRLMGIILLGMLVLAACGSAGQTSEGEQSTGQTASTKSATADLDAAYDFRFSLYQGEGALGASQMNLSDLQGKPLVLNFWAGLCPPCRAEMPDLQEFYDEFGDSVTLLGLDVGPFTGLGSRQDGRDLLQDLEISYPAGSTEDVTVARKYEVLGMPSTIFITPDGKILRKWTGLLNKEALVKVAKELLAVSGVAVGQSGNTFGGKS